MKKQKKPQEKSVENSATGPVGDVAEISTVGQAGPEVTETVVSAPPAADDSRVPETAVEAPADAATGEDRDVSEAPAAEVSPGEAVLSDTEIEEMVRQAYLRGRNEAIEALMRRPGMMQPLERPAREQMPAAPEGEVMILNNPRPSIWDR